MASNSKDKQAATRRKLAGDDFASVAKRLECDEDKERFEKNLGKIARSAAITHKSGKPKGAK